MLKPLPLLFRGKDNIRESVVLVMTGGGGGGGYDLVQIFAASNTCFLVAKNVRNFSLTVTVEEGRKLLLTHFNGWRDEEEEGGER